MSKRALITGISGQDGRLLTAHLLRSDYKVLGIFHKNKPHPISNSDNFQLLYSDYSRDSLARLISNNQIDEIYHLAGKSNVQESKEQPSMYLRVNTRLIKNLLEACLLQGNYQRVKVFNASSSEIFSGNLASPQSEITKQVALSPYGESKIEANKLIDSFRSQGLFIANGILYNHESSLRPENFFTSKVIKGLTNFSGKRIPIGNLKASRDWGLAVEYVESFQRMLHLEKGEDFIIATGKKNTVKDFIETTMSYLGLSGSISNYFLVEEALVRNDDTSHLVGNTDKAKKLINWNPEKDLEKIISRIIQEYRAN